MSVCLGEVEIEFGQANLRHALSVEQAHFIFTKILEQLKIDFKLQ